jgi:hypothetical protein
MKTSRIYDAFFYKPKDKKTKLIVGQVQSGKTTYMIEQAIKALKEDFDAVIVMGGNTNLLLNQTNKRFKFEFKPEEFNLINVTRTEHYFIPNGKTLIFSLKTKYSLEKLLELLKNSNPKKILFLDDESDYGGINIGTKEEKSLIYSYLRQINNLIMNGEYFSITATPFADLLNDNAMNFDEIVVLPVNENYTGISYFNHANLYEVSKVDQQIRNFTKNEEI